MITEQEFLQRRHRLKKLIAERGASHFVATSSDSIFYLCGASFEALERPFFLIIPRDGGLAWSLRFLTTDDLPLAFFTFDAVVFGFHLRFFFVGQLAAVDLGFAPAAAGGEDRGPDHGAENQSAHRDCSRSD